MDDRVEYDEDERLQEEYALMSWDQQNGDYFEDYEVEYNEDVKKFVRI